jgi:hypothetical protein
MIRRHIRAVAGVDERFRNKLSAEQRATIKKEIVAMLTSGVPRSAIAKQLGPKYGIHVVSVYDYIGQVAQLTLVLKEEIGMKEPHETRRRGRPQKAVASAQDGVRTILVDGARAELILRREGVDRVIASLLYQDEAKLMSALERSMDELSLAGTPIQAPPEKDNARPVTPATTPAAASPAVTVIPPQGLLADIRNACLSGVIPTNRRSGQCYVLPDVTYLASPAAFHRLVEAGVYKHNPSPKPNVYLEALATLPCVRKPEGCILTPITLQPEGRPFWVVTLDTRGLFQPEDLAKLGMWKDSIRELTREEAKLAKQRATSPPDVKMADGRACA